jgi:hypothetical protein
MVDGVFERCNEFLDEPLELLPFYNWIGEMKRLHEAGQSLPVVPLVEFAFGMDEKTFHENQRRARAERLHFDCTRTQRELEHAGIVTPMLTEDQLQTCVESMIRRDSELRARMERHSSLVVATRSDELRREIV